MKYMIVGVLALQLGLSGCDSALDTIERGEGMAVEATTYVAHFTPEGELVRPEGWREWVYMGSPVTPNALNGGQAILPEFHVYYIDPASFQHYKETGEFRDGTLMAAEMTLVMGEGAEADGSTHQVSGRGYFQNEFAGLWFAIKDSVRFADEPGNWAHFSFGLVTPSEYADSAPVLPVEACSSCHQANGATDQVFTQFYPMMRAAWPGQMD